MGRAAERRSALLRRRLVADALPGPLPRHHDAGVQPARRRPPRRARRPGRPVRQVAQLTGDRRSSSNVSVTAIPVPSGRGRRRETTIVKRPIRRLTLVGGVVAVVAVVVVGRRVGSRRAKHEHRQGRRHANVGWEQSFGFTDSFDPTGEYLGDAFGIYSNLLVRTLVGYNHVAGAAGQQDRPGHRDGGARSRRTAARPTRSTSSTGIKFGPPVNRAGHVEGHRVRDAAAREPEGRRPVRVLLHRRSRAGDAYARARRRRSPASRRRTTSTIVFNLTAADGRLPLPDGDARDRARSRRGRQVLRGPARQVRPRPRSRPAGT